MTSAVENVKLSKSVGELKALRFACNQYKVACGAVVQLGARNTGSVEVTGSSPVSSTIFMYGLVIALLIFLLPFSVLAQDKVNAEQAHYVPDVVVVVFSGIMSDDTISCTYNKANTSKEEAKKDVEAFAGIVGANPVDIEITSKALPPSKDIQTSSEFKINGLIDYKQGGLYIEPFISTFKRFKNIEVNYIINKQFNFRGLRNHDDKHVSITMLRPYQYRIIVKDSDFTSLNLPVVVETQTAAKPEKPAGKRSSSLLVAAVVALAAGGVVYFVSKRFSKPS